MKTVEERLNILEQKVNELQTSFIQARKNDAPMQSTVEETARNVETLTPYTETKQGYIGDTEVTFTNVKDGNLSVFIKDTDGNFPEYSLDRQNDTLTVYFEPLENVTDITISIS